MDFGAIYIHLAADILVMDSGDISETNGVPVWPLLNPAKSSTGVSKSKTNTAQLMPGVSPGRPSKQVLFLKEKSTNNSIKQFFTGSPGVKRPAALNDNLENLSSPTAKKTFCVNPSDPSSADNSDNSEASPLNLP